MSSLSPAWPAPCLAGNATVPCALGRRCGVDLADIYPVLKYERDLTGKALDKATKGSCKTGTNRFTTVAVRRASLGTLLSRPQSCFDDTVRVMTAGRRLHEEVRVQRQQRRGEGVVRMAVRFLLMRPLRSILRPNRAECAREVPFLEVHLARFVVRRPAGIPPAIRQPGSHGRTARSTPSKAARCGA